MPGQIEKRAEMLAFSVNDLLRNRRMRLTCRVKFAGYGKLCRAQWVKSALSRVGVPFPIDRVIRYSRG
ncbi:hypothetical protein [Stappia sp. 28M-7]|uniref:hypothetical protein n=1 Tax=Stappia sp. 28M-7 TaxID=2762596 RepID=UPI000FEF8D71|nr:hypothetical protein [Stappia sp. 28M-7]MBC2860674.1 hypothetical protein [Stappia sp. 28M-7]